MIFLLLKLAAANLTLKVQYSKYNNPLNALDEKIAVKMQLFIIDKKNISSWRFHIIRIIFLINKKTAFNRKETFLSIQKAPDN
jgi:hypothetical protein